MGAAFHRFSAQASESRGKVSGARRGARRENRRLAKNGLGTAQKNTRAGLPRDLAPREFVLETTPVQTYEFLKSEYF